MSDSTEVTSVTPETPAAPTLNVNDIQMAVRAFDHAAEQGAWKGWTIIQEVMALRNRFNDFAEAVAAVEPAPAPAADTTDPVPPTDTPAA